TVLSINFANMKRKKKVYYDIMLIIQLKKTSKFNINRTLKKSSSKLNNNNINMKIKTKKTLKA
ncbi:MAG: hypothetical protein ACK5N5_00210, partial [Synechococcales cyanobacterium]